jgi:hypothetical protein
MEHKSRQLAAEILQSIENALQGNKATSDDMDSVTNIISKEWESYMASVEKEPDHEPPGVLILALFLIPLDAAASPQGPVKRLTEVLRFHSHEYTCYDREQGRSVRSRVAGVE